MYGDWEKDIIIDPEVSEYQLRKIEWTSIIASFQKLNSNG